MATKGIGVSIVDLAPTSPTPQVYLGEQYVNNPLLSDVTFIVEGKRFYAHRACLLSSDIFRAMFDGGYKRGMLLDCETQIERLLATVFENYKSLDENLPTGLTDHFGPASDSAAPALHPALQVFSSLHDILSPDAQTILENF